MTALAIIGAGTMGRRLAFDFARAGHTVALFDAVPAVVDSAVAWIESTLGAWEGEGRVAPGTMASATRRLQPAASLLDAVSSATAVFENVPERLALKRSLFAELGPLLDEGSIIVSNTSSLPGSLMADASARPDRFINANFSHLGHQKVEVMPHPGTSTATTASAVALLRGSGFIPLVLRAEQFGYAGNRVWRAIKKEVLRQLAADVVSPHDLDRGWMLDWQVAMGPCALMDAIGLDVVRDIEQSYADYSGDPSDRPPLLLERMVAEGRLGVKSGEGFYRYPEPAFAEPLFLAGA